MDRTGIGVAYALKKPGTASDPKVKIEATRFNRRSAIRKDDVPIPYLSDSDMGDLLKEKPEATILFREEQEWDKTDDWLWRKMERFDAKGTFLMRCVRMK